ncbi:MAG: hypothetical protein SFZ02_19235 [bacterium]|nr:hypothetical protein [bacterium]
MSAVVCPKCGGSEHVVMVEDGVWMCTHCTIEFNGDGRVCGGLVEMGKSYMISDHQPAPFIIYGGESSSPKEGAKVMGFVGRINIIGVKDVDELMRELYKSLKRASE